MNNNYFELNELKSGPFKYLLITAPIDSWKYSLTLDQLIANIKMECSWTGENEENEIKKILEIKSYIEETVTSIEEKPYIIRYTSIPVPDCFDLELVGMAKIENNGMCFIFSNNKKYLESIDE